MCKCYAYGQTIAPSAAMLTYSRFSFDFNCMCLPLNHSPSQKIAVYVSHIISVDLTHFLAFVIFRSQPINTSHGSRQSTRELSWKTTIPFCSTHLCLRWIRMRPCTMPVKMLIMTKMLQLFSTDMASYGSCVKRKE